MQDDMQVPMEFRESNIHHSTGIDRYGANIGGLAENKVLFSSITSEPLAASGIRHLASGYLEPKLDAAVN